MDAGGVPSSLRHGKLGPGSAILDPDRRRKRALADMRKRQDEKLRRLRLIDASASTGEGGAADSEEDDETPFVGLTSPVLLGAGGGGGGCSPAAEEPHLQPLSPASTLLSPSPHEKHSVPARMQRRFRKVRYFSSQLSVPEWMTAVPSDLNGIAGGGGGGWGGEGGEGSDADAGWWAIPRPEGTHCLVVASSGVTTARTSQGFEMFRFYSGLPGGSPATSAFGGRRALHTPASAARGLPVKPRSMATAGVAASGSGAVLDCVYNAASATFYVCEVLLWNEQDLCEYPAPFRAWWAASKFAEAACPLEVPRLPAGWVPAGVRWAARASSSRRSCSSAEGAGGEEVEDEDEGEEGGVSAGGDRDAMADESEEAPPAPQALSSVREVVNEHAFVLLPTWECDARGFAAARGYAFPTPGVRLDGLLFVCKAAPYSAGPSPLRLRWRDPACSFVARRALEPPRLPVAGVAQDIAGIGPVRALLELRSRPSPEVSLAGPAAPVTFATHEGVVLDAGPAFTAGWARTQGLRDTDLVWLAVRGLAPPRGLDEHELARVAQHGSGGGGMGDDGEEEESVEDTTATAATTGAPSAQLIGATFEASASLCHMHPHTYTKLVFQLQVRAAASGAPPSLLVPPLVTAAAIHGVITRTLM